jgi:nucleotide-binding universal stress UspA family protein
MNRILVAVDGSEPAERAAQFGARLASRFGAVLTLAHAVEGHQSVADLPISFPEFNRLRNERARKLLETIEEDLDMPPRVKVELRVLEGNPAEAVASFAKEQQYDLIAVGSKGRGALSRVLVGSTTDRLVHLSEIPVVVVP